MCRICTTFSQIGDSSIIISNMFILPITIDDAAARMSATVPGGRHGGHGRAQRSWGRPRRSRWPRARAERPPPTARTAARRSPSATTTRTPRRRWRTMPATPTAASWRSRSRRRRRGARPGLPCLADQPPAHRPLGCAGALGAELPRPRR